MNDKEKIEKECNDLEEACKALDIMKNAFETVSKQFQQERQAKRELVEKLEYILKGFEGNWCMDWNEVEQLIEKHKEKQGEIR